MEPTLNTLVSVHASRIGGIAYDAACQGLGRGGEGTYFCWQRVIKNRLGDELNKILVEIEELIGWTDQIPADDLGQNSDVFLLFNKLRNFSDDFGIYVQENNKYKALLAIRDVGRVGSFIADRLDATINTMRDQYTEIDNGFTLIADYIQATHQGPLPKDTIKGFLDQINALYSRVQAINNHNVPVAIVEAHMFRTAPIEVWPELCRSTLLQMDFAIGNHFTFPHRVLENVYALVLNAKRKIEADFVTVALADADLQ